MGAHTLASGSHFARWWTVGACLAVAIVAVLYVVGATTSPPAGGGIPVVGSLPPVRTSPGPSPGGLVTGGLVTGGPAPVLITGMTVAEPPPGTVAASPVLADLEPSALSPAALAPSTALSAAGTPAQPIPQLPAASPSPAASTAALAVPAAHPSTGPEPAVVPPPEPAPEPTPSGPPMSPAGPTLTPAPEPDPDGCVRPGRDNPGKQPYKKPLVQVTPDDHTVCVPAH